jgi:hypothetical protein
MSGSRAAYWARTLDDGGVIQHSFWLFEEEADAHAAKTMFNTLRDLPEAPAEFVSADVCEVISQM